MEQRRFNIGNTTEKKKLDTRTSFETLAALRVGILWEQTMAQFLEQVFFRIAERLGIPALLVAHVAHAAVRVALLLPFVRRRRAYRARRLARRPPHGIVPRTDARRLGRRTAQHARGRDGAGTDTRASAMRVPEVW